MSDRDPLTGQIVDAAIEVHRNLGPGLLESSYQAALAHELALRSIAFRQQCPVPLVYKEVKLADVGYRCDFIVENRVVVEIKAEQGISPLDEAQLLTYLKLSGIHTGLLLNFNVRLLRDGIMRRVV